MLALIQAIDEGLHKNNTELSAQTWEQFDEIVPKTNGVLLFGTGEGLRFALERFSERHIITGVLDNNPAKIGKKLGEIVDGIDPSYTSLIITSPEQLDDRFDNVVVLVTSIRYFDEMTDQIHRMGGKSVFSLLHMEANRLKHEDASYVNKNNTGKCSDPDDEKLAYASKCADEPIHPHKLLLSREEYGSHGLQIFKSLLKQRNDLDLVWVVSRQDIRCPDGVRLVSQSDWKSYIYELETAHIWLFGDMIPDFAIKRAGQKYIQLKHWGSLTLKKFYMDLPRQLELSPAAKKAYQNNSEAMDYIFVGSDFDEISCRSGFAFDGNCIRVGSPRSDVLFQDDIRKKVFEMLNIEQGKHVLIYAPTFRSMKSNALIGHMKDVDLDFEELKNALEISFGGEWLIWLRIHPYVAAESFKVKKPYFVKDVSNYPDSIELMAAADASISDYSSILFEHAYVGKPVFLYAPDLDEYLKKDRELLMDYTSLPFPLSYNNADLVSNIINFNKSDYRKKLDAFLDKYNVHEDGKAAQRAAEFISMLVDKEQE